MMLINMHSGELGMQVCQMTRVLLYVLSTPWLLARYGPVISCAQAAIPIVATILATVILLWGRLHPTQLLIHAVQNPPQYVTLMQTKMSSVQI